ncbi:hypothetical protein AAEU31_13215 [Pseudoalteromonas sp. SSMSWG5]|jgi:hypothetical protein|uniref:hypothetical protein n=1 Tax=Pseudoalteromonas TaxID=53246 RepID=UPI000ECEB8A2|nr:MULTISPECIES: hypothetical protein [unclassified Pseudoalteromonas]HCV01643.1 hypothetical protein [Pseudoalteromonas sp.]MCF2900560.1 hypothetical protein [Pseudoalteromonas sp. OFAV1]MCF2919661.1 hypothetical protein [Pseudoalteromonas sp. APAL1]MCO7249930.1 hypothetical protein [Pseudoalteromonas sp. Ps84H-4]TGV21135.1 hypothetical protein E5N72_14215 [Pseudoalteromonas sp. MEBiC 03607]|tara:strand:- start:711 stop:1091 length:381 start_codon:yes stop_codon:yes gene_type:complete
MDLFIAITALLGAYSTYFLAHHNRFDGIRASAATSIIAFSVLSLLSVDVELYSVAFFGGTFIGMSAPKRFGIFTLAISSLLFAMLFEYLVPRLHGYGGALGVSAFLSVCVCHIGILLGAPRSKKSN